MTTSQLQIEQIRVSDLKPHPANPRVHPKKQIRQIAESIKAFGFRMPVIIDQNNQLICGHARIEACKLLGQEQVPAVRVTDLDETQIRGLMIADNRLTEISIWDDQLLGEHLKVLSELDLEFDIECIGFDYGEIEQRISQLELSIDQGSPSGHERSDELPNELPISPVTKVGDHWTLGEHRILCGDSTDPASYKRILGDAHAAMVFTDPPYNLPARSIGQVCKEDHGDFAMGSGEMSPEEFTAFLGSVMKQLCAFSVHGSIHYLFMDWRHMSEMLAAGNAHYSELKNLCVWVKDRAGMGSFYRSQHELVFVFKHGEAPHRNHFKLGEHGRTRSNIWSYPSVRSLNPAEGDPDGDALKLHPTIKPVRLIEDAILDCSRRGEIVLDPFLGSGSTLIACEKTRRHCVGIELSPRYVDVAITRWQLWTGREAVHEATGRTFNQLAEEASDD
ncbi:MAG: DNA methylase N-4 [Phycisphaerae bacterium]|nr:DNA methylase N-4 [Phycisphaerae bacterium]MBM92270.1 DNA methylase N-4 [Phycisphaerae bacterium]HCT45121.1 DNA methylase N-4 [Phycisphaerales bacterium]